MKQALLAVLAAMLVLTLSCQKSPENDQSGIVAPASPSKPNENDSLDIAESDTVQILDDQGQPIAGARILIGPQESSENPWLITDEKGRILIPETWVDPLDVTVQAPGFVQITLKDQAPSPLSLSLRKSSQVPSLALKGNVSGITTKDKDGWIDFSVALDSLTKNDVLNFNMNKVMSPWTEKISAAGFDFPVPQNLFLPKQKESYLIFSVTLQKPNFVLNYDSYGLKSLYTLKGKFPLKKMISELQNKKPYYELVNFFEFSSAGRLSYDFTSTSPVPVLDASQITLDKTLTTQGPKVAEGQVIVGISAFKENGHYQPLDIKYIESEKSISFKTASNVLNPHLISVVKNTNEFDTASASTERMSVTIEPPKAVLNTLPLINDPIWNSGSELEIDLPTIPVSEFTEQGMLVVISDMQELTLPDGKVIKYKLPAWEIHVPAWTNKLTIPNLNPAKTSTKRVEVTLLAKTVENPGQQNAITLTSTHEERIENATHLTKSALDF